MKSRKNCRWGSAFSIEKVTSLSKVRIPPNIYVNLVYKMSDLMEKIQSKLTSDGCFHFYTSWWFIWDQKSLPNLRRYCQNRTREIPKIPVRIQNQDGGAKILDLRLRFLEQIYHQIDQDVSLQSFQASQVIKWLRCWLFP